MADIYPGRFTAKTDKPFVVFLIGLRINKLWAVHKWLPAAQAMSPMIAELLQHSEKGFLGGTFAFTPTGPLVIQYWRSFDDLERFARNPSDPHLPAWRRFNQKSRAGDAVGVWHETYLVQPDQYEAIYVSMPKYGLGSVMEHIPVVGRLNDARDRLKGEEEQHVESAAG